MVFSSRDIGTGMRCLCQLLMASLNLPRLFSSKVQMHVLFAKDYLADRRSVLARAGFGGMTNRR